MHRNEKANDTSRPGVRANATPHAQGAPDHEALLRLQRTAGNEAVASLLDASPQLQRDAAPTVMTQLKPAATVDKATVEDMIGAATVSAKLRENVKATIVHSVEKFARACQKQKDEIRAEMAEDKELFSMIVEIGFSFIPGLLPLKEMAAKGLKKGVELAEKEAEKVVEASLKGVQRGILSVRGSHESELEGFLDELADRGDDGAAEAIEQADGMTDAQLEMTYKYYRNLTAGYFEGEIKKKLQAFKESVRHVGEFRYWEFGAHGKGQAAYINTGGARKLALVTYPTPIASRESFALMNIGWQGEGQPVFLDWIPKEMVSMAKEKQFNEFGPPFKILGSSDYLIPPSYMARWFSGLTR
jgi:hypothetical protein